MPNQNVEILRGEPEKAIKKLSIPILISVLLTATYNIIDTIWIVGLGKSALAGIGFVTPIFMILNGVAVGLGNGASSSISRAIGAKKHQMASKSAMHSLFIFFIASIFLTIILLFFQKPLLISFGANGQSLVEGIKFGTPLFLGLFTFLFSAGASGILRGEGDTKRAMYAMLVSVILNCIFDPILIYTCHLGSAGASISTVLSSLFSAILILYWILSKKDTYVEVNFKKFKFDLKIIKDILKVGIPSSIDIFMMSIAMSFYLFFISTAAGEIGVDSFITGQKLYLFGVMPLKAISCAVATVCGSAFGSKNWNHLSRAHMYGSKLSMGFSLTIMFILLIFAPQLASIFAYSSDTVQLIPGITQFLQVASFGLLFVGLGMPSSYMYQGIGRGTTSLIWTIIRELLLTVSFTYLFGFIFGFGLIGIWIGLVVGRTTASILNFIYARYTIKKLKNTQVI